MSPLVEKPGSKLLDEARLALVGKFAAMSKRDAQKLIRQHGGVVVERPDPTARYVIVGEADLPLGDLVGAEEWLDDATRSAAENGQLQVVSETQLWQWLGLVEQDDLHDVRRLYTTAMLADLLKVPTATIRRWHRRGLIQPKLEVRRLAYFDFQEVATARRLAQLLAEGISPARLEKKLAGLARFLPDVQRRLTQLSVIVEGKDILLLQGDGLIDAGGQRRFDFAACDDEPDASLVSGDDGVTSFPASALLSADRHTSTAEHTDSPASPHEMMAMAAALEDEGQLRDAAEFYRAVLAACGPDAEVNFRLAELLYRLGDVTAARERYYAVIEVDEDYVEARANLGCVLAELAEHELAVAAFEGALAYHSDYADVHFHLARTLDELGREDDAVEHWRRFVELAPESPWANEARRRLERVE